MSESSEAIIVESAELCGGDVSLHIPKGAKVGIIASSRDAGAALLQLIADRAVGKAVSRPGSGPQFVRGMSVWGYVGACVAELKAAIDRFDMITREKIHPIDEDLHDWLAELEVLQKRLNAAGAWDLDVRMKDAILGLRCPPANTKIDSISDSHRRHIRLAGQLVAAHEVLLLDEPSAELDADSSAWLEQNLQNQPGTVVFTSQDRALLYGAASHVVDLRDGRAHWVAGGFLDWLAWRPEQPSAAGAKTIARQRAAEREVSWVRAGRLGRRAGSTPGASTLQRFLAKRSASEDEPTELAIAPGPRLGDEVIGIDGLRKHADGKVLIDNLCFNIPPGSIVGVIGAPGIGKSTLARIIAGREPPDRGTLRASDQVVLAHTELARLTPRPDATVIADVSGGRDPLSLGDLTINCRNYLSVLDFSDADMDTPVAELDGPGRERLMLAKLLLSQANVLIFDEPLRCLSLDARRALEDALSQFVGCAVVATNDRWFLNRVATHILAFEGDSQIACFTGNYDGYVAHRMSRRGPGSLKTGWPRFKRVEPEDEAVAAPTPAP